MRTKDEILNDAGFGPKHNLHGEASLSEDEALVLEVAIDIRDILEKDRITRKAFLKSIS